MRGWSVVLKDPDVYVVEAHQPGFEAVLVVVDPDITATVCLHDLGGNSVETPLILSMFGY